ncbi:hypothetical protein Q8F55_001074 [Vanrija albida]|uniref:TauD/TfdA-like domain-containing protein n=1 Tax=Vanrija albida TaxID=181172 RepID=A0ABR3QFR2_9TREE
MATAVAPQPQELKFHAGKVRHTSTPLDRAVLSAAANDAAARAFAPPATTPAYKPSTADLSELLAHSHVHTSPSLGTEFRAPSIAAATDGKPSLSIRDVLEDEGKIKALARLVSERGVVFFRDAIITPREQEVLVHKLGLAGGKPTSSGIHIHPYTLPGEEHGDGILKISSADQGSRALKRQDQASILNRHKGNLEWHSDISFERVPSDYATLQVRKLPPNGGGDTVWASGYEAYERLSPATRRYLEGLTAYHDGSHFHDNIGEHGQRLRDISRGAPENTGPELDAVHPVIRTNPTTGWKTLFVPRNFTRRINELTQAESDNLLEFLWDHVASNHDIQTRFRWEENNLAIWDNRSTYHARTWDTTELREGTRSVSLGERPFYDPQSKGRREALGLDK